MTNDPKPAEASSAAARFDKMRDTVTAINHLWHRHILIGRFFFVTTLVFLALAVTFAVLYITK